MTGKEATDKYWGIINSGDISKYSAEEIQALISKLSTLGGEGPLYARTLANMQSSSKMFNLSDKLLNFNSDYYKQYASYLQKTSPQMGVNTLLAPLMAGSTGYAGGQAIANQKMQEFIRQRQDKINTGVQGFALGNLNVGANLLGQQGQLGLGYANLNEQQREFDEKNSGWNQLFGVLGSAAGSFLPGLLSSGAAGGAAAAGAGSAVAGYGATAAMAASDIRVKENIERIGSKNGFNIYKFNYKGNPKKYSGVIAQEVEKIRPDAVSENNGIKYVDYSKIGIEMKEI